MLAMFIGSVSMKMTSLRGSVVAKLAPEGPLPRVRQHVAAEVATVAEVFAAVGAVHGVRPRGVRVFRVFGITGETSRGVLMVVRRWQIFGIGSFMVVGSRIIGER